MEWHLQHCVAPVLQRPAVRLGLNCSAVGRVAGAPGRREHLHRTAATHTISSTTSVAFACTSLLTEGGQRAASIAGSLQRQQPSCHADP
jgi:hypothetical protein